METKRYIDLHSHTIHSDGSLTPKQQVEAMAMKSINLMAITDHDSVNGYREAKQYARNYKIKLIPGAEITTPKYHLLALNFNPIKLESFLKHSRNLQLEACAKRVDILQGAGVPISIEDIIEQNHPGARIGKWNLFMAMLSTRKCKEYLTQQHPAWDLWKIRDYYIGQPNGIASNIEPRPGVTPEQAIQAVHDAGGIIGIAHPVKDIDSIEELESLVNLGLDFIEIQPNLENRYSQDIYRRFAREKDIPISYGSDYHGPAMNRPLLEKGDNVLTKELGELLK